MSRTTVQHKIHCGSAFPPERSRYGQVYYLHNRTVESHVSSVLMKLNLPESGDAHRRVLAVIAYLRAAEPQR